MHILRPNTCCLNKLYGKYLSVLTYSYLLTSSNIIESNIAASWGDIKQGILIFLVWLADGLQVKAGKKEKIKVCQVRLTHLEKRKKAPTVFCFWYFLSSFLIPPSFLPLSLSPLHSLSSLSTLPKIINYSPFSLFLPSFSNLILSLHCLKYYNTKDEERKEKRKKKIT